MALKGIEKSKSTLDKVNTDIAKRTAMNAKTLDKINKIRPDMIANGYWDPERDHHIGDFYSYDEKTREILWKLDDLCYNLRESEKKLKELEEKRVRAEAQYQKDLLKQKEIDEIPEIFKELRKEVADEIFGHLTAKRTRIQEAWVADREFYAKWKEDHPYYTPYPKDHVTEMDKVRKIYGYSFVDKYRTATDEEIRKDAEQYADGYIMNLINRVTKYIGEITDFSNLYLTGPAINGIVIGERGKVRVETILAGGYNIQCLHNRVLVKPIK
jgi:vacuolar-type H+-ATPase subunit I/STV1